MRRCRDQAGMSLVEVIVATAIIAVALAPLINVFMTSQKSVEGAATNVEAMALARSALDVVLNEDFHTMSTSATEVRPWVTHPLDADYEVQVTIQLVTTYMKRIMIEVRHIGSGKVVTLYSTVAQRTSAPESGG